MSGVSGALEGFRLGTTSVLAGTSKLQNWSGCGLKGSELTGLGFRLRIEGLRVSGFRI